MDGGFRCAHRRSHLTIPRSGTPCGRLQGRLHSRAPQAELERRAARAAIGRDNSKKTSLLECYHLSRSFIVEVDPQFHRLVLHSVLFEVGL